MAFQLDEYKALMTGHNLGFEAWVEGDFFQLWPLDDLDRLNRECGFGDPLSDYFCIGSNGAGEACLISRESGEIVFLPFIGAQGATPIRVAESVSDFVARLIASSKSEAD